MLRRRKRLMIVSAVAGVLLLGWVARVVISSGFPLLPPPAGPFLVGTAAPMRVVAPADGCPLSVQLWYPAEPGTGRGPAAYPRSAPAGWLSLRRWIRTSAVLDATIATAQPHYPVLLYLPGWSGEGGENTALVQELVSQGFIVAAIDYTASACAEPGTGEMDFSSPTAFERTVQAANRRITRIGATMVRVVDLLTDLNSRWKRFDLDQIGVIGNSFGGAIGVQLCWLDQRVKAAIDIDGWLFDAAPGGWIRQPFLFISDDGAYPTASDLVAADPLVRYPAILVDATERRRAAGFARYGGMMATILDTDHADFSDAPFLRRSALLPGARPDGSAIRIVADYAAAFFAQALRGKGSALFSSPPPRVHVQIWKPPITGD